jgi:chorismate synthase
MKIVIAGPKGAGKTTVSRHLGEITGLPVIETDALIEQLFAAATGAQRTCREIFESEGQAAFRARECAAVDEAAALDWHIIVTGGSTMLNPDSRRKLRADALIVYITGDSATLWTRATEHGIPPWLTGPGGPQKFADQVARRDDVLTPYADVVIDATEGSPEDLARQAVAQIGQELAVRQRAANTYGDVIRVTTFGESHGTAIGAIMEGVRPGIPVTEAMIQEQLDRRRPGQSKVVTQRKEPDQIHILSGVYEGKTTGAPIALVIYNEDQRSKSYDNLVDVFRPGHADFTFYRKYGHRDHRGGGRSSGRETATRVVAGATAKHILEQRGVTIRAHATEIAGIKADICDYDAIEQNTVRSADPEAAKKMEQAILDARRDRDSVGGIIQIDIDGVPPGLGDPVFGKLDARLTAAIMTIGAIKGVEIGDGFALAKMRGSEANDAMREDGFVTNHAGGITGGISNGARIVLRLVVKPTASIAQAQPTINKLGENVDIEVLGRHDPCIIPRAVPVVEHMAALTLLDAWEVQARLRPDWHEEWTKTSRSET